ncbi:organic hydroperoxide resistance protein [Bacteroidales bacterium OttesenSCG-928-M06]|nr:organic hydroperoxide resistance protein [Bacteroidales bacterium OttesenSCG-928-M06]
MKALYTAIATSIGGRDGYVKSSDGVLDFEVKKPKEMGGPGGAYTNPEQLFAAGYAACFSGALSHVGLLRRVRVQSEVTAKVTIGEKDGGNGFELAVEMDIHIPGMEQKLAEELAHEAHQFCPYSNATRNNVDVKIKVTTN